VDKNEYIDLFHKLQLNEVAFKPLFRCDDEVLTLVNAALAQRTWVGLTDEEVGGLTVFDGLHHIETPLLAEYVLHIQAKLKEKNGG